MRKNIDLDDHIVTALRIEAAERGVRSVKQHMENILTAHVAGSAQPESTKVDKQPKVTVEKSPEPSISGGTGSY